MTAAFNPDARNLAKAKEGPRAAAQRERILDAARQCFIDKGFHGASMALIAATAAMSPGLMYRYFPSKNAIVLEIIRRQLERSRMRIQKLQSADEVTAKVIQFMKREREGDPDAMHGALFLETSAEGSRDAQIGEALQASDRQIRTELLSWFAAATPQQRATRESRAVVLQCLLEGLAVRLIREPALDLDMLAPVLCESIEHLLGA